MKRADYARLRWTLHEANPLIAPPWPSPVIADPTVVTPEHSPDGAWHLFAHSLRGIHHYTGADGIRWRHRAVVVRRAMRPCVRRAGDEYLLYYERTRPFALWFSWLPRLRWRSSIALRASADLVTWGPARHALAPSLSWHRDERLGESLGNPCLTPGREGWLLYVSASLVPVPDCGFNEPRYIGVADGPAPAGPWTMRTRPVIEPDAGNPWCNLGAGAIKVFRCDDGFVGFQNGIYRDAATGVSGSAILLLESEDGARWRLLADKPLLVPAGGWMRSHVYALDVARDPASGRLFCYFNARDDWHWTRGREHIGLLVGEE